MTKSKQITTNRNCFFPSCHSDHSEPWPEFPGLLGGTAFSSSQVGSVVFLTGVDTLLTQPGLQVVDVSPTSGSPRSSGNAAGDGAMSSGAGGWGFSHREEEAGECLSPEELKTSGRRNW